MSPLAFVALRTDGHDPARHDLVEIAVARTEPFDAHPCDVFTARVRPTRTTRDGDANDADGLWLVDAMDRMRALTRGCVLVAYDAPATRSFLDGVCQYWELLPLQLATHAVDVRSLSWPLVANGEAKGATLAELCAAVDITYHERACALEDVRALAELYRWLIDRTRRAFQLAGFTPDERAIVETIIDRIAAGRDVYGAWRVDDGRNNPREALAEVMDALNYCAAELVRLSKGGAA